jgi:hypothetical protein
MFKYDINLSDRLFLVDCQNSASPDMKALKHELTMVKKDILGVCASGCSYSQICPDGHLPLTVICVMRPLCFCPSAAHSLLKQSVLNGHLSYTATNFWTPGWPLKTDLTVFCTVSSWHQFCSAPGGIIALRNAYLAYIPFFRSAPRVAVKTVPMSC